MRAPPPIGGRIDDVRSPSTASSPIEAISLRKFDVIDDVGGSDDDDLSSSCCPRIRSTRNSASMEEFMSLPLKLM